jgi:DNA repair protein RadC
MSQNGMRLKTEKNMLENNNISEITVSYSPLTTQRDMPVLTSSTRTHELLRNLFPADLINLQEHFIVVYLNKSSRIIGFYRHSTGGITGTVADIRIILAVALKCAATGIILTHNHPSGNVKPSGPDIELTRKIKDTAKLMDIKLLDHLIISAWGEYFSFADDGLL